MERFISPILIEGRYRIELWSSSNVETHQKQQSVGRRSVHDEGPQALWAKLYLEPYQREPLRYQIKAGPGTARVACMKKRNKRTIVNVAAKLTDR